MYKNYYYLPEYTFQVIKITITIYVEKCTVNLDSYTTSFKNACKHNINNFSLPFTFTLLFLRAEQNML